MPLEAGTTRSRPLALAGVLPRVLGILEEAKHGERRCTYIADMEGADTRAAHSLPNETKGPCLLRRAPPVHPGRPWRTYSP